MNCTNLITCIGVANESFPYWNVIAAALLATVLTFSITLCAHYIGVGIGGIISSIPTSIVMSMFGIGVNTMNMNDDKLKTLVNFSHTVPVGLFVTNIVFMLWVPLLRKLKLIERIKDYKYIIVPITLTIMSVVWLITMALISGFIYVLDLSVESTIALGWSFEALTIVTGFIAGWKRIEKVEVTKKGFPWSVIIRSIIAGVIVAATVTIGKFKVPVITGVIASFPTIKLVILFNVTIANYDQEQAIEKMSTSMALGNSSAGIFTMVAAFLLMKIDIFIALFVAYTTSLLIITGPTIIYTNILNHVRTNEAKTTNA